MDLYRSFTTRRSKHDTPPSPEGLGRAASQRAGRPVLRGQISSPLALVSTSNMMLNNAQHIAGTSRVDVRKASGSSASSVSDAESDASSSSVHTRDTLTDASSLESPSSPEPEPNHLSCYFKPKVDTTTSAIRLSGNSSSMPVSDTPAIPQRVPSHSKKAHETLHRKRSVQRIMSPSRNSSDTTASNRSGFVEVARESPFGNELAQLDEVAEEFGSVLRDAEASEDARAMRTCDLARFGASDYMTEIESLVAATFGHTTSSSWI